MIISRANCSCTHVQIVWPQKIWGSTSCIGLWYYDRFKLRLKWSFLCKQDIISSLETNNIHFSFLFSLSLIYIQCTYITLIPCNLRQRKKIQWTPSGDAFIIGSDLNRLESETLPQYFRHNRFQSLVRQVCTDWSWEAKVCG